MLAFHCGSLGSIIDCSYVTHNSTGVSFVLSSHLSYFVLIYCCPCFIDQSQCWSLEWHSTWLDSHWGNFSLIFVLWSCNWAMTFNQRSKWDEICVSDINIINYPTWIQVIYGWMGNSSHCPHSVTQFSSLKWYMKIIFKSPSVSTKYLQ
jgi:hypothetical protein